MMCMQWVLDFLLAKPELSGIKGDLFPYLVRKQWTPVYVVDRVPPKPTQSKPPYMRVFGDSVLTVNLT